MQAHPTEPAVHPVARVDAGTDPDVAYAASLFLLTSGPAVATAVSAVELAIRTAAITGDGVPGWAGAVAGLLEDWSQQLGRGGGAAGQAGTARTARMLRRAPLGTAVLARFVVPAAPLSARPLVTWLRLRLGVRRCLACGQAGNRSLQPAHPLVSPARARTWRCTDRLGCRRRRTRREERR
jgi:hypothetical protein